jgi:hypothetical protein
MMVCFPNHLMIFLFQTVFSATEAARQSPALLHRLLQTSCCKQVQEDEEIQKDIDFQASGRR